MAKDVKIYDPNAKKERAYQCGHCPRKILKSNEPEGFIYKKDGKPICIVCRATKLTKFSDLIKQDKASYEADQAILEEKSRADAMREVTDIAMASQIRARRRRQTKKFL